LESSIVLTPEQIDNKFKNFVSYINSLSTDNRSNDHEDNEKNDDINNDKNGDNDNSTNDYNSNNSNDNHNNECITNKNDFFEEGIISDEEEKQIKEWKLHTEIQMDKIEEKVAKMKIEE